MSVTNMSSTFLNLFLFPSFHPLSLTPSLPLSLPPSLSLSPSLPPSLSPPLSLHLSFLSLTVASHGGGYRQGIRRLIVHSRNIRAVIFHPKGPKSPLAFPSSVPSHTAIIIQQTLSLSAFSFFPALLSLISLSLHASPLLSLPLCISLCRICRGAPVRGCP